MLYNEQVKCCIRWRIQGNNMVSGLCGYYGKCMGFYKINELRRFLVWMDSVDLHWSRLKLWCFRFTSVLWIRFYQDLDCPGFHNVQGDTTSLFANSVIPKEIVVLESVSLVTVIEKCFGDGNAFEFMIGNVFFSEGEGRWWSQSVRIDVANGETFEWWML